MKQFMIEKLHSFFIKFVDSIFLRVLTCSGAKLKERMDFLVDVVDSA